MVTTNHWQHIAERWNLTGSPFRPCAQDLVLYREALGLPATSSWRALILGVTPELQRLDWPSGSTVVAVDRSEPMIRAIWPGDPAAVHVAQWDDLPFADQSFDRLICDGGLHLQSFPDGHTRLVRSLARVLRSDGRFVIRLFTLPTVRETVEDLMASLHAGAIASFHEFKMRLAMALQEDSSQGVQLDAVFRHLVALVGSLEHLASLSGWPLGEIQTVHSYENSHDVYHFLTEAQSVEMVREGGWLEPVATWRANYPLSERCPVIAFRRTTQA